MAFWLGMWYFYYAMGKEHTVTQVAEKLCCTSPTVRRLLEDGDLRGHRLGVKGPWRITEEAVAEFLKRFESPVEDRDAKP